ncbi:retrovirus-related pol polyprotein from transposon TNT 1-94 [Tanacetum coccineum]
MAPTFVSSKLDAINHLARHGLVRGLPKLKFEKDHMCFACAIGLKVHVRRIRTDNGTEFVNQTLREYYEKVGISYETSVAHSHSKMVSLKDGIKAFRIYNRCTRRIIETIHVDFDELTAMASEHSSSGPALHEMNPATISSGLVPNPSLSTPVDHSAPEVVAPIDEVAAPIPAISTGSPSSTIVDQDAPSPRIRAIGFFSSGSIAAQMNMVDNQKDDSCDSVDTPMVEKSKLDEDKEGKAVDPSHYRAVRRGDTTLLVNTEYQLADIFTKALGRERIEFLINKLGMRNFTPETLKQLADEVDE